MNARHFLVPSPPNRSREKRSIAVSICRERFGGEGRVRGNAAGNGRLCRTNIAGEKWCFASRSSPPGSPGVAPHPVPLPQKTDGLSLSLIDRFSTSVFRGRGGKRSRAKCIKLKSPQTTNASQYLTFSSGQARPLRAGEGEDLRPSPAATASDPPASGRVT